MEIPLKNSHKTTVKFSWVQSLSRVRLFATSRAAALQASLSITNSRSSLKLTSIESVMPSSHLILCHPLFLLPSIPPSIRVFSNESTLPMRWSKYWWKDAQHHSLLEKCKSKPQWGIISCQSEWLPSKSLQTINAGKGVEKRECSCTVGGNVNWYSHYGRWYGDSLKN